MSEFPNSSDPRAFARQVVQEIFATRGSRRPPKAKVVRTDADFAKALEKTARNIADRPRIPRRVLAPATSSTN